MDTSFELTAAVLAVAAIVGFVATRLRQPLIVAFIAVGVLVGPAALGWVGEDEPLELLAEIGIAVLLFLVGLKLDLHLVRATGRVALTTGLGQVAFTSVIGFGLALLLGMDPTTAVYVAVALTFSSTIIIVKLLSDKRELEELHGRIALGFLIVQDIVVVLVMIVLSATGGTGDDGLAVELGLLALRGVGFVLALLVVIRWVLPRVLHQAARSQELLLIVAVAWAVVLAALGEWIGFSTEVGAFIAGFAIASTPYREAIGSSLAPLRDFLLLFFFIGLGATLDLSTIGAEVPAAIVLSLFVLIGNPLIVLVIMGVMGYRKRVGFLAGLTVAQISEFSLIFVALGLELGHLERSTLGLVTLVGLVTIGVSTYLILYSKPLYERLAPLLSVFERRQPTRGDEEPAHEAVDVVVYGYGRFGSSLVHQLAGFGLRVLVIDWDPAAVRAHVEAEDQRVTAAFGDAEDHEFPGTLPLDETSAVVCTIPSVATSLMLASALRRWGFEGLVALTAHSDADAERLAPAGAGLVLRPFEDASADAARRVHRRLG